MFEHTHNFRVPDLTIGRPLLSRDERRQKFPMFAKVGIREVWLVHPHTREVEVYRLESGAYVRIEAVAGVVRSPVLEIALSTIDGPALQIADGETTTLV